MLQVEVDKVRQTQWVPGGNVRAAKIAAGPLAHCCRTTCVVSSPPITSLLSYLFLNHAVSQDNVRRSDIGTMMSLMFRSKETVVKMLPGGTWRRQNSRRSFGLLSPNFKLSQADFHAVVFLVYLTGVFMEHGMSNYSQQK